MVTSNVPNNPYIIKLKNLRLRQWISIVTMAHVIHNDVCMNLWHYFLWLLIVTRPMKSDHVSANYTRL